jgi:hypothetical protein
LLLSDEDNHISEKLAISLDLGDVSKMLRDNLPELLTFFVIPARAATVSSTTRFH